MSRGGAAIVVVGSLNRDVIYRVPRIPSPGETIHAAGVSTSFGGKGANQAVAAARAGGTVTLLGCVGRDDAGTRYIEYLRGEGVRVDALEESDQPTGSAVIFVDEAGENCIVVDKGANHAIRPSQIDRQAETIRSARMLLMQLECPLDVVKRAAEMARAAGVCVVVNPSPWTDEYLRAVIPADVLIVNELEAAALAGDVEGDPLEAARARSGCSLLVVTRGARPTRVIGRLVGAVASPLAEDSTLTGGLVEVVPPKVQPVDTVGAGDAFAGALTVALAEGMPVREAVAFANTAGALATLRPGAQGSIPHRSEIAAFLGRSSG